MATSEQVHDITYEHHGLKFHYRYLDRGPGPLFVSFPSARPQGKTSLEYYARVTWARDIPCSMLFVADPMLQLGDHVSVSAFQGRPEYFLIEDVAADVRQVAERFGHPESRMIFYGSSVGGTAAIQTATYIRAARVIAECPQLQMRECHFHMQASASAIARMCYDVDTALDIPAEFEDRFTLAVAFQKRGAPSYLKIFVRESDKPHVELHARPFVAMFPETELQLMDDTTGKGHSALAIEEVKGDILRLLAMEARSQHEFSREPAELPA